MARLRSRILGLLLLALAFIYPLSATAKKAKLTNPAKVPKNAILLSKVESLTFYSGRSTTGRRGKPVPQLTCAGPADVCALYAVDVMRCTNEGADYEAENIQWACKASVPAEFKLGGTEVVCEGYESPEDPYVLRGSCGVEYRLLLTDLGEEKYGRQGSGWMSDNFGSGRSSGSGFASAVFFLIFAAVLFIIVRGFLTSWRQTPRRPGGPRRFGGGGGGGNDDNDNDDPPPYDSHGFNYGVPPRKFRSQGSSSSTAGSSRNAGGAAPAQGNAWRPGFWTGAAAGGAAAYLASQRNQRPQTREDTRAGGLFGGGGSDRSYGTTPSGSGPSFSNTRHESTGFGGTRRR